MKEILKPIFELLTGDYILFHNVIYNYIAMSIIGYIAYKIVFGCVGNLFGIGIISSKEGGSLAHWIIRLPVFIIVFCIFGTAIWLIQFAMIIPLWAWSVGGVVITIFAVLIEIIKRERKTVTKSTGEESQHNE